MGDRFAGRRAVEPANAPGVGPERRNEDAVFAGAVEEEVGLLPDDGRPVHDRVGRVRERALRRVVAADEDHVPDGVAPVGPFAVAGEPLLLRGGDDLAVDDRVGQEPAAGVAHVPLRAPVEQLKLALDVQPPQGGGLGDRDPRDALCGLVGHVGRRRDGEVLQRPPEVVQRVAVGIPLGVDGHGAVDVDVVGVPPEAGHVGVEADVEVDVVLARLEEQRIAFGAELVLLHLREDVVRGFLDVGGGHARVEHEHVRAEDGGIGLGGRGIGGDDRDRGAHGSGGG